MQLKQIRELARKYNWTEEQAKDPTVLIFHRTVESQYQQINVWHTRMTVATSLNHPRKGKNQLYRWNVGAVLLEKLFENPRTHTQVGYRTKERKQEVAEQEIRRRYEAYKKRKE